MNKEVKEYVEKMDTEEVIKVLEIDKNLFKLMDSEVYFYNKVINFLERGKKYEEMWEELDDFIGYSDYEILQKMKELKQKYFPKVVE